MIVTVFPVVCSSCEGVEIGGSTSDTYHTSYWHSCTGESPRRRECVLPTMGMTSLSSLLPTQVYVSVTGSTHCPLLLRDLLATEEMEQALGHTAVSLLNVYVMIR